MAGSSVNSPRRTRMLDGALIPSCTRPPEIRRMVIVTRSPITSDSLTLRLSTNISIPALLEYVVTDALFEPSSRLLSSKGTSFRASVCLWKRVGLRA